MIYCVFEAGGRAGLSARFLFEWHMKTHPCSEDRLILVDSDEAFLCLPNLSSKGIITIPQSAVKDNVDSWLDITIFPADEIARQSGFCDWIGIKRDENWAVLSTYYNKSLVNNTLKRLLPDLVCDVGIPATFELNEVFVKPNEMSAGSKGLQSLQNVCVSEKIDIKNEYVIDVLRNDKGGAVYFGRQVQLRAGYDKYIKFLEPHHSAITAAMNIVNCAQNDTSTSGLFNRIFHIQLAEDHDGCFWFIEASKRISGTSLVNILFGFDPFEFMHSQKSAYIHNPNVDMARWYLYEDLLTMVYDKINGR